jgi:alpha-tubulin suppressor-like RCC1 family protein
MSGTTSTLVTVFAAGLLSGCFLDELPSAKDDGSGITGPTPPIRSLAVGGSTSCAVLATGAVRCWGSEITGLGGVPGHRNLRPVAVKTLTAVEAMALAPYHGCVLIAGNVSCYGSNDQGQVGNGQPVNMDVPLQPAIGATAVVQLSLNSSVSSARTSSGTVLAWGAGFVGFGAAMPTPVAGLPAVTDVSNGGDHDCAVHGGMVSCWGWSTNGQLGRGTIPSPQTVEQPALVINVSDATQVIAGPDTCVLHADGTVSCWGGGTFNPPQPTPTLMAGLTGVQKLIGAPDFSCALMTAGTVACWGDNHTGALGIGADIPSSTTPVTIPGLSGVVEVAAGNGSTCARRNDGEVLCWGANVPGDGSMQGSPVPVQVRW